MGMELRTGPRFRIGDYVGAMEGKDGGEPTFGRVESTGFTPADELYIRTPSGELTGPWMVGTDTVWHDPAYHVDYPHHPGTLYDCPACEAMGIGEDDDIGEG